MIRVNCMANILQKCMVWAFIYFCQENYFGDDQKFRDFEAGVVPVDHKKSIVTELITFSNGFNARGDSAIDPNMYRPLHVTVQLDVRDIQAHLVKV